jgi:hypothetical protein
MHVLTTAPRPNVLCSPRRPAPRAPPPPIFPHRYPDFATLLCQAGALFIADHSHDGRRWMMPSRLPDTMPEGARDLWNHVSARPGYEVRSP